MNSDSTTEATRRLGRSASAAVTLHVVALVTTIVAIISDALEIDLFRRIAAGQYISERIADSNDTRQMAIAVVLLVAGLVAIILFFVWLHRAYVSLHRREVPDLRFSPGWAVGWFFIPILSLYKPYQVVSDLWKASRWGGDSSIATSWRNLPTPALVLPWWLLWLSAAIAGRISWFAMPSGFDAGEWIAFDQLSIGVDVVCAASWLITIPVIRTITAFHLNGNTARALGTPPASPVQLEHLTGRLPAEYCEKCGRELEIRKVERSGFDRATGLPVYTVILACPEAAFYETDLGASKISWRVGTGGHTIVSRTATN